jgi:SAM-dependent methyltransferase
MEFVEDRRAAFAEVARTLRPYGVAIIGVLNRQSVWEITRRVRKPFSHKPYYKGRFFSQRELRATLESAGLHVDELETVAHFPPIPPGPFTNIYRRLDAARLLNGGVILCHATRPNNRMHIEQPFQPPPPIRG